jgi:uncharacterized protein YgbK (DUF1537 family)
MRPPRFAILADDLTGALDCAAAFITPRLAPYVAVSGHISNAPSESDVVSVNADTRRLRVDEAERVTRTVLESLSGAGCEPQYVKIDSTLRGHPGLEISLLAETYGYPLTLVCPAFPATGRTVRDGNLLVHGVPLNETEVAKDPLSPLHTSQVAGILRRHAGLPVTEMSLDQLRSGGLGAHLAELARSHPGSHRLVVCDAETDADLDRVAEAGLAAGGAASGRLKLLFAGSAGLAFALARASQYSSKQNVKIDTWEVRAPMLVVTASQRTLADWQIAVLESAALVKRHNIEFSVSPGGDASAVQPDIVAIDNALESRDNVVLRAIIRDDISSLSAEAVRRAADGVTARLGELVEVLAKEHTIGGIVIIGGDTAHGVLTTSGARGILLHAEPLPGVPLGTIMGGVLDGTAIATKAGAFGDDQTLFKLVNYILSGGAQP